MTSNNVEKAKAILRALAARRSERATTHVGPNGLIQHDPAVADGTDGLREHIGSRSPEDGGVEIVRVVDEAPFVVVHGRDNAGKGEVFFAVFRFENDLLVEQWRFSAPMAPPNRSGHTQTDGPTDPDHDQDAGRSKAIVREYYESIHVAGQHDRIGQYMSDDRQIRHEPGVRDGVAAFEQDLSMLTRSRTIDEIVLLVGEGDLVFVAARGTHHGQPCAYLDLYRVEADKLVEHWGFPQAMPPGDASRNANGLL